MLSLKCINIVPVTFWILALDHDLRLVRGELAYVALSDPAGTKVAIWEELSMDEGTGFLFLTIFFLFDDRLMFDHNRA